MDDGEQGAEVLAEVTTSMTSSMDRASQGSVSNRESETRELSQELLLFSSAIFDDFNRSPIDFPRRFIEFP